MPAPRGPSTQVLVVLVAAMLATGCSNSLFTKWQDMQCVENCNSPDPTRRQNFEQPVWQTATMFLGELLCLIAFILIRSPLNPWRPEHRRVASAAARKAAMAAQAARLANAPLSRPDESAIFFNESDISLHGEVHDAPKEERAEETSAMDWKMTTLFWAPAAADIAGTTCMNVGLLFVPVSVYQMLRGALVLWVGVFSVVFLHRKLTKAQWMALATVMLGVAVVGCSSLFGAAKQAAKTAASEKPAVSPLVGVGLILVAQVFTASQFVMEERIMERFAVDPLLACGSEGLYGLGTTVLVGLPLGHFLIGRTPKGQGGYFDVPNGWHEIIDNSAVWKSSIAIAVSIAFFNFCGLAVTKSISATARSTIDTCRTLGIWLVSLYLGWEKFSWLQVLGFSLLVYGTFIFNGISKFPEWTGFHNDDLPSITLTAGDLSDDEEEENEEATSARSRSVDSAGRPVTRRSGSGRRGEISPLLKNVGE